VSTTILDIGLMSMLVVVAIAIIRLRSLFAIVMLQGVYSLVCAAWFVSLDAVDVAFTEAAVGAGISTVLMLAAMLLADRESKAVPLGRQIGPMLVVLVTGLAMFYAIGDMPAVGDKNSPANSYVGMDFMDGEHKGMRQSEESCKKLHLEDKDCLLPVHIPNVVTVVLGSYRGYDTFGEAVVIFSAGLGVLLLLGLNGNAGKWRARPNGVWVGTKSAPSARRAPMPKDAPKPTPKRVAKRKPAAKRATSKKPASKNPTPKKPATKKATATKRKPGRPKTGKTT